MRNAPISRLQELVAWLGDFKFKQRLRCSVVEPRNHPASRRLELHDIDRSQVASTTTTISTLDVWYVLYCRKDYSVHCNSEHIGFESQHPPSPDCLRECTLECRLNQPGPTALEVALKSQIVSSVAAHPRHAIRIGVFFFILATTHQPRIPKKCWNRDTTTADSTFQGFLSVGRWVGLRAILTTSEPPLASPILPISDLPKPGVPRDS